MLPKHYLFLLLLLPALCWTACEKSIFNPQPAAKVLPPITTTGAGTFGCKINGEVFLHTPKPFDDHITVYYDDFRDYFYLNATESIGGQYNRTMHLYVHEILSEGIYQFHDLNYTSYNDSCMTIFGLDKDQLLLDELNQMEIIHFDPEARIISGIFQFTVVSEVCQDTFRITEGRFDMPWLY
jgi:hypothetical protein